MFKIERIVNIMNNNDVLMRRVILLVLFLILLIIIGFWKRSGEISSEGYSVLVVDSAVILSLIITDVCEAWRKARKKYDK